MKTKENTLTIYVIYERPNDYPNFFVVRPQYITAGQTDVTFGDAILFESLEAARRHIPTYCAQILRSPDDLPAIVESWF